MSRENAKNRTASSLLQEEIGLCRFETHNRDDKTINLGV
jgi:hypothetical protein